MMRLICFGDSLTRGVYGGSFFDSLVKLLPDDDLLNAGEDGNTVLNLLHRLDRDVLSYEPDAVFITVGGNDAISYSQPATRPYYRQAMNVPDGVITPEQFTQYYRELLTQLQLAHILVYIGLEPCEYSPTVAAAFAEYNALAAAEARALGVPALDMSALFPTPNLVERPPLGMDYILTIGARLKNGWADYETAREQGGFTFTFDGLHLTPQAARTVARAIADFIRS